MVATKNWGAMRNEMRESNVPVSALAVDESLMRAPGVSYSGGLGFEDSENSQLNLDDIESQRKRTPGWARLGLGFADLLQMSGGDEKAYVGRNYERKVAMDKLRAEEDPEGYQADLNRAKLLSRKAAQAQDENVKAQYGKAIKKLFPHETQGMDDVTASAMFMSDNDKLQLEMLKGENALRKQMLANEGKLQNTDLSNRGKLDLANVNNASKEQIAQWNNDAKREIADLNAAMKKAIADGNNERALQIAEMIDSRQRELAVVNGEYKLANTALGNEGRAEVAGINADAAMARVNAQQEGANYRAGLNAENRLAIQNAKDSAAFDRAQLSAETRKAIAETSAGARIEAAKLGVQKASPLAINNGGIVQPSQGVIDAIAVMEKNPGAFSATTTAADTLLGRATGVVSGKTVRMRQGVKQSLAPLVRESVQQLMALFPKGGSGVINTAKEQEFFVPVAEAINSGEMNKIIPAIKAFYGNMYDEAAKYGEPKPMSRSEFITLMTTGKAPAGYGANAGTPSTSAPESSQQQPRYQRVGNTKVF